MVLLNAAALLLYAETWAFAWDEGYHLVTARLILEGKRPYLDFCFPQTPVNAYWNAAWMSIFGQTWQVTHIAAALLTMAAVLLAADYIARRFPAPGWTLAAALVTATAAGFNQKLFLYGPLGQPYGTCLFALVAAFRLGARGVRRNERLSNGGCGLFAGIAAGSSLLTAAAAPVLFVWTLVYTRAGERWRTAFAFAAGALIPFLPVAWLAAQGPRQAWFNIVEYHARFRKLYWPNTTRHDLEVLTSWIDSGQALLLGLLAVGGLIYIVRRSKWPDELRREFYLAAWLAAALATEVGRAHPTFPQYFLLVVPFLAILAPAGAYAAAPGSPRAAALTVSLLTVFGMGRILYDHRESDHWAAYEHIAAKVAEVTPPGAPIFVNDPIYFLLKRTPPPGMELYYTHRLKLPPADRALFHILTDAELVSELQSGKFPTAYTCDDGGIGSDTLAPLYRRSAEVEECKVFWDFGRSPK